MADRFTYDVFLSHNSKDKPRVRPLAEKLRAAGLRVWFDEWVLKPGDDIYLAIERGLEAARAQVLCLSPTALGSEWVTLERSTVLFRDPTNADRRFIPLLLADCELPDALRRYKYVDYRRKTKAAFKELLDACRFRVESVPHAPEVEPSQKPAQPPEQAEPLAVRYVGMEPCEKTTAREIRDRQGGDGGARISREPTRATPPQHSDRIDLEFWADIDVGPLGRAFEQEIIGQRAVKRAILNSLRSHSARCRELLLRNPAAIKAAHDERYRLPVISLFGASGMGKTTYCRVMAQHLFGIDELASIIDLSGKYVSAETRGLPPPHVGWDQESTLIRLPARVGGSAWSASIASNACNGSIRSRWPIP